MSRVDWPELLAQPEVAALIELALREDLGSGDVTTGAVFTGPKQVLAHLVARRTAVIAGLPLAAHVLAKLDPQAHFSPRAREGEEVAAGAVVAELSGDVRSLLSAERTLLNFVMRLSGVATAARRAVEAIPPGARAKVFDTRKTLPGWRRLDKAAVRIGGAENHRLGLWDAVLIKDNHIAAAGSLSEAVRRARRACPGLVLEVEVDTLAQLQEALAGGPDIILLDNFDDDGLRRAVAMTGGRCQLEASGGVTLARLAAIADTGVDRISMGALTHSAAPADLALDMDPS